MSKEAYIEPPFPLTPIDLHILSLSDAEYTPISWPSLKTIIATNTLEDLKRRPSDLRRYITWSTSIKRTYGGITSFVISERLKWEPLPPSQTGPPRFAHHSNEPFKDVRDYAILRNDWPYGFEAGIEHLLVWSKVPIEVDESGEGDVTERARGWIREFVRKTFVEALEKWEKEKGGRGEAIERVLWFKNWVSLQSVRGVDHVHVLVKDAPPELLEKWTRRKDL